MTNRPSRDPWYVVLARRFFFACLTALIVFGTYFVLIYCEAKLGH